MNHPNLVTLFSAQSGSSSFSSTAFGLSRLKKCSIEITTASTDLAGTLKLQVSNDGTHWEDVANTSTSFNAATKTSKLWDGLESAAVYIRIDWARSAGTGNFAASLNEVG